VKRRRGFTLVEVLVALVIVALGMAALLSTLTSAADSTVYLREKTLATWIALNKLSETRLKGTMPTTGTTKGEVDYAGRKWFWEQTVQRTQVRGIVRIDVRVQPRRTTSPGSVATPSATWTAEAATVMGDAVLPANGTNVSWISTRKNPQAQQPNGPRSTPNPDGGT
jgi:general secretion pathway protein I